MTHSRTRGALAAAALTLALGPAQALELLVPAYFYPPVWDPAQRNQWREMQQALSQGVAVTAILNPGSGPGTAQDPNFLSAVNDFRAAGGRVLGYVYTCYGMDLCATAGEQRSTATVLAQAERYAGFYAVDGIFLDEMGGDAALAYYRTVTQALRSSHPGWQLVGNPGAPIPAASAALVDTVMTFEQGRGDYGNTAPPEPWMLSAAPSRQAHIHYNVSSFDQMKSLLTQAVQRRAGYVYITDDRYTPNDPVDTNPFNLLPSYWAEEVLAVKAINAAAVPEPGAGALWLAALGGLALWRGRRAIG